MRRFSGWAPLLLALLALPAAAQEGAGEVRVRVAPAEAREVVAEGRAPIDFEGGGVPGARKAAQAQALRAAVEKALGVYVAARTLTQNYQLIHDQVTTRAEGFAVLKEILREEVGPQEVRVTLRAVVSLRPLAQQLKALQLTRLWRVRVVADPKAPEAAGGVSRLEKALTEAGFPVVGDRRSAEIEVTLSPRFLQVAARPLETAAGEMTMYTIRGETLARATRIGTGEVVAALQTTDTALHIHPETARSQTVDGAAEALAPRLVEALLVLPASLSQPVTLAVSGLGDAAQAAQLESALRRLGGVQGVTRRTFASGRGIWELDVLSEGASTLARDIEALRPFRLQIASETRARIVAVVRRAARL